MGDNHLVLIKRSLPILMAVSFFTMLWPNAAISQEKILRTLTVTGQGRTYIPTTISQIQLGVEVQGKNATEVQQEVAKRTSSLVKLLQSSQVERLQTTGIQLQPNYDYSNNQRKLLGYIGTNTVSFRIGNEQAGALLDRSIQAGATRIDGISFTSSTDAMASAQKQALTLAAKDAKEQADAVLNSLNLSAKGIVGIQLNSASAPQPQVFAQFDKVANGSAGAITPVVGGEQTIEAAVTLQISY